MTRDALFCGGSVAALVHVLSDGSGVTAGDAIFLLALYALYVLVVHSHRGIVARVHACCGDPYYTAPAELHEDEPGGDVGDDGAEAEPATETEESGAIATAIDLPLTTAFAWTIPDCSAEEMRGEFAVTLIMSIAWIGLLSFLLVQWACKLGCLLGMHPAIVGCTLLAAGLSAPDAIGSLSAAREGVGGLAVSSAIGSAW